MLRRIGFEYAERIDPFDGGPHFIAKTDDITLVQGVADGARGGAAAGDDDGPPVGLVSVERDRAPHFAATGSRFRLEGGDVGLPAATIEALGVQPGDSVGVLPFVHDARRRRAGRAPRCVDIDGNGFARARELWRARPALILWVRHFG